MSKLFFLKNHFLVALTWFAESIVHHDMSNIVFLYEISVGIRLFLIRLSEVNFIFLFCAECCRLIFHFCIMPYPFNFVCYRSSFFSLNLFHTVFIHLSIDRHLGCFQILTLTNIAATNRLGQVSCGHQFANQFSTHLCKCQGATLLDCSISVFSFFFLFFFLNDFIYLFIREGASKQERA